MTFDPSYYTGSVKDQFENRHPLSKAEEDFNKLPPEAVRNAVELAMWTEEKRAAEIQFHNVTVPAFLKMYPAYINNDHNMHLMKMYWEEFFGVEIPSFVQLEDAYVVLRTRGALQLNKKVVDKEDAAQVAQDLDKRIAERKAEEISEEEMYAMPWDQFEKKARGWK
jgi:hypothetical protein